MIIHEKQFIWIIGLFLTMVSCSNDTIETEYPNIIEESNDIDQNEMTTDPENRVGNVTSTPTQIRGVKWRQNSEDEFLQPDGSINWWLNKPSGTSKMDVFNALANNNVNSIVIRVDRAQRFKAPSRTNYDKAMKEIVNAISQASAKNVNIDIYLWGRIWMERDGAPNHGTIENGAIAVKDWFTPILNEAKNQDLLDKIKGIILVETNIDQIEDVKKYAKRITDKFNANQNWNDSNGNTFFRTRTFMMPGCGYGLDFRNVGNDNGAFLQQMQGRCKNFAFLYKFMQATHETVTYDDYYNVNIDGVVRTWNDMETNSSSFTKEDRIKYLKYFGSKQLTDYINSYKNQYPSVSNIVFWGDKWDGISKTPPLSRQALHSSLVYWNGNTGHFFNLAASNTNNSAAKRFYLLDESTTPNQTKGWGGIEVYREWDMWSDKNANY